jgi:hypothetical protein
MTFEEWNRLSEQERNAKVATLAASTSPGSTPPSARAPARAATRKRR